MSTHVEWTQAEFCQVAYAGPGEEMADGQEIDPGKHALVIGSDCDSYLVVEGSPTDLLAFATGVRAAARETAGGKDDVALDTLHHVGRRLREKHKMCTPGMCPWRVVTDEDMTDLAKALTEAGYSIERK